MSAILKKHLHRKFVWLKQISIAFAMSITHIITPYARSTHVYHYQVLPYLSIVHLVVHACSIGCAHMCL